MRTGVALKRREREGAKSRKKEWRIKNGDFLSANSADGVFLLFSTAVITTVSVLPYQIHSDKSNDSLVFLSSVLHTGKLIE
jgi:hypothetical protein